MAHCVSNPKGVGRQIVNAWVRIFSPNPSPNPSPSWILKQSFGHTYTSRFLCSDPFILCEGDLLSTSYVRHQLRQNVSGVMSCLMHAGISCMHAHVGTTGAQLQQTPTRTVVTYFHLCYDQLLSRIFDFERLLWLRHR
jgi:hypothetical protein